MEHSTIGMTPFQALYGRRPPSVRDYIPRSVTLPAVEASLQTRQDMLTTLRNNLKRARQHMMDQANKHRLIFPSMPVHGFY